MNKITLLLAVLSITFMLLAPSYTHAEYNPTNGRFLQRDLIGYVDGMNVYEYVKSRPVQTFDIFGLFSIEFIGMPKYRAPKGAHSNPDKRCVDAVRIAIALRADEEERVAIADAKGGLVLMRKHERWKVQDCKDNRIVEDKRDTATFVRALRPAWKTQAIRSATGDDFISPFYSVLMYRSFKINSACCSKGTANVVAQFLIYAGKPILDYDKLRFDQWKGEHGSDYDHYHYYPGWELSGNKNPIAKGYIKFNFSWDCKQKVKATIKSDVSYTAADGMNTREGRKKYNASAVQPLNR